MPSNYGYIAWQRAAQFGSLEALWIWAKEVELNTHELLLSQSGDGYTAFQLAARKNHVKALLKMWVWAEETQLNPKVLKKNLFLSKDDNGYIVWHRASIEGSIEALETLWGWAKEVELKADELLLAQTGDGLTAFQTAAQNNHVETLLKLWVWAGDVLLHPKELKKSLFLAKDKYGNFAWHRAAVFGSLEALETLWDLAKGVKLNTDELLLSQNGHGYTAFQLAALKNHVKTLLKMWVWAEEMELLPKELKKDLFLAKDNDG